MKKVIYIDVGTHFGQEFQSAFGKPSYFFYKAARRLTSFFLFRRGRRFGFTHAKEAIRWRLELEKIKDVFVTYLIEANPNVICESSAYKAADGVFNLALTGDLETSITRLYLVNSDELGQGSSILVNKRGVNVDNAVTTIGIPSQVFFEKLQQHLDSIFDNYSVILRLNCEGVEDDVIYGAHAVFAGNLALVMGSLKDVRECKGDKEYAELQSYMQVNELPFVAFSTTIETWGDAHKAMVRAGIKGDAE